jgi:hypothetical protein
MTARPPLIDTGRTTCCYGEKLVLYRGETWEGEDYHERATLPDGRIVFVREAGGYWGLYTHQAACDYGGNEYGRRVADRDQTGILSAVPPGVAGRTSGRGLIGCLADFSA